MGRYKTKRCPPIQGTIDIDDRYVLRLCIFYLQNHLNKYHTLDNDLLEIICWVLGEMRSDFAELIICFIDERKRKEFKTRLSEYGLDDYDYSQCLKDMLEKVRSKYFKEIERYAIQLLDRRYEYLEYEGSSTIENNIKKIKKIFNFSDNEINLCTFLFIMNTFDPVEYYFSRDLKCEEFSGRKYLCNALNISPDEINEILTSTIARTGLIEIEKNEICLSEELKSLFQNPSNQVFSKRYYSKIPSKTIPLNYHFIEKEQTDYLLELLKNKPKTSTHILLYGKPGTGKTSYAYGVVKDLGVPAYEIAMASDNTTKNRRAAIRAAINMTNSVSGSIIIVDEADNLLNTKYSWFMRGETQDKGYLNQLMEERGIRIIWICNRIGDVESSVLRRFAFSLPFKTFNRKQRIRLWETVLRKNKVKRFFSQEDIKKLASKYDINAGSIDLTVKKAVETHIKTKKRFHKSIEIGLGAYKCLTNNGEKMISKECIDKNYSLEGLNINENMNSVIKQIERFIEYQKEDRIMNLNLLFHGPPGTGKSELARYIAKHFNIELISKRLSDILSPYVGIAEKNIRSAFDEAEREDAILVIDEADSLLFSRDRAVRSWEASQTNEFLTAMERFRGILICTTNMMKELDNASIRRFNFKIKFDFLKPEGNVIFYNKLLIPLTHNKIDKSSIRELESIPNLCPGDFKTVRDKYFFQPAKEVTHNYMIDALKEEANIKNINKKNTIGF